MKVKELIAELDELDPEAEVVLSSDCEGNSYSPMCDFGVGNYRPTSEAEGEFQVIEEGSVKAVCLFPVR